DDEIPEELDLIMSDDGGPVHTPPARIAARFHRSTTGRRKSSAASSRRNSISSNHSHHSNRSFRSGCQSTHVAQHLRRASIIESRKARLADRAAHAEQVRLRAALAKAATRASNSEERTLAAQQAREKYLAQVAAACAEEVKRAKKVAEEMKERKAAEERRFRLEMEEKHAEAERRRLEYKKNGKRARATSSPSGLKKVAEEPTSTLDKEQAARRIQRAWRSRYRKNALQAFTNLGLSIDRVSEMEFETVSNLLKSDTAIDITAKLLSLFPLQDPESGSNLDRTAIRMFLTAYIILGHPAAVLSKDGHLEKDLITKAKDLLICFEAVMCKSGSNNAFRPPPTQVEALSQAYNTFLTAFNAWKEQDASTIIETMVASFVELDAIWQTVKDDSQGEVANDYREGIRMNQTMLLSQIKKVAGPDQATTLIKKAIRESRRARARRRPIGDVRPRPVVDSTCETRPETAENSEGAAQAVSQLDESKQTDDDADFLTAEFGKIFSPLPSNRVMVHELSIDKEYRIDVSPQSDIRDAFNRQLCDSMRKGIEQGQGPAWTVAMAENIRGKLLRLLQPGNSMHNLISEALDPGFIQTQATQGVFSYDRFFSFMGAILPKLCAPFRDAEVKAVVDELPREGADVGDMIDKLFKVLHIVDLLSLDYSNFLLTRAAPTLLREASGYEQRAFASDLETGATTLQKTRHWWRNASVNAVTEANQRDPEGIHNPADRPTFLKIYARGLVDLAIATVPLPDSDLPETLHLDRDRLTRIRADTLRITTIGAILLTAKNLLKRDTRSQWKPESARLWELLKDNVATAPNIVAGKVLSILESSHAMPPATRSQLSSAITRFLAQASSGRRLSDPFMRVLLQRLKGHVLVRVSASSSGERVRAASTASERLANSALPEFGAQVGWMVEVLGRVSEVDRKAHGRWYDVIAKEVE
ncbi:hypothetical protein EV356DRAFT_417008, partial [Viridothelium virens]